MQNLRWRTVVVGLIALFALLVVGLITVALVFINRQDTPGTPAGPAPAPAPAAQNGSPIDPNSPRPPDDPALAPDDDPAAASTVGVEAQKLLDELRTAHGVAFSDADANILVDIGDRNVLRGVPDLQADDPEIASQVAAAFPGVVGQQRADTVRCMAEYVEQTIARNNGTVPPDGHSHI